MDLLDNVMTDKGPALVVGFPDFDMVEVRVQASGELRIFHEDEITPIADAEAVADFQAMEDAGLNPVVPDEIPRGKDGRPLRGVALRNYLAKQQS